MSSKDSKMQSNSIPLATIQAFSRSIYKEASKYGFGNVDIIKLINELMDLCSAGVDDVSDASLSVADFSSAPDSEFLDLPLRGSKICIREFRGNEDAAYLESWLPDKYGRFFVLSCATAQEVTAESLSNSPNNHLGMITMPDGRPIGAMAYLDHSKRQQRAELRKLIGDPESRGKGYAEEATWLWIRYGVLGLGLEKIYVSTLQTQIANIRLNESIGFQVEGLLRNEVLIDDQRYDVLRMGFVPDSK